MKIKAYQIDDAIGGVCNVMKTNERQKEGALRVIGSEQWQGIGMHYGGDERQGATFEPAKGGQSHLSLAQLRAGEGVTGGQLVIHASLVIGAPDGTPNPQY